MCGRPQGIIPLLRSVCCVWRTVRLGSN